MDEHITTRQKESKIRLELFWQNSIGTAAGTLVQFSKQTILSTALHVLKIREEILNGMESKMNVFRIGTMVISMFISWIFHRYTHHCAHIPHSSIRPYSITVKHLLVEYFVNCYAVFPMGIHLCSEQSVFCYDLYWEYSQAYDARHRWYTQD